MIRAYVFLQLQDTLKKIERGNGCSKDILLHHLLPNVICTGVIDNKAKTMNVNDKYIIVERNDDDELFVDEDATIVTRDIMGTNGVIHVIDKVLIPEAARTVIIIITIIIIIITIKSNYLIF